MTADNQVGFVSGNLFKFDPTAGIQHIPFHITNIFIAWLPMPYLHWLPAE
jgi:hypothetical protein